MFHRVRGGGVVCIRKGPETVTDELMALSSGNIHYLAAACRGGGEIRDTQLPPRGRGVQGTRVLFCIISHCEFCPGDEISARREEREKRMPQKEKRAARVQSAGVHN